MNIDEKNLRWTCWNHNKIDEARGSKCIELFNINFIWFWVFLLPFVLTLSKNTQNKIKLLNCKEMKNYLNLSISEKLVFNVYQKENMSVKSFKWCEWNNLKSFWINFHLILIWKTISVDPFCTKSDIKCFFFFFGNLIIDIRVHICYPKWFEGRFFIGRLSYFLSQSSYFLEYE